MAASRPIEPDLLRPVRSVSLPMAGGLLVVTAGRGPVCLLNETSGLVWRALGRRRSLDALAQYLARRLALSNDGARSVADKALAGFAAGGLIAADDHGAPGRTRPPLQPRRRPGAARPVVDAVYRPGTAPVRLRCEEPALAALIEGAIWPCRVASTERARTTLDLLYREGRYLLRHRGHSLLETDNPVWARGELLRHLILQSHPGRRWLVLIHAAVVAGRHGAVLLCGPSGSGKSTLAGTLVHRGAGFVSDDYAPIERGSGAVWPVPFGLSVKAGSWPVLARRLPALMARPELDSRGRPVRYVWPEGRAPMAAPAPLPVLALIFPLWEKGASLAAEPLTPAQALALLAHGGACFVRQRPTLAELAAWLAARPALALSYGDVDAAAAKIEGLLDTAVPPASNDRRTA